MTMAKKLTALFLLIAVLLSFAGCNYHKSDEPDTTVSFQTVVPNTETETPADTKNESTVKETEACI